MKLILSMFLLLNFSNALAQSQGSELDYQASELIEALNDKDCGILKHRLELKLIRVRTILDLGIEIPVISKFAIRPEIELFFTRD